MVYIFSFLTYFLTNTKKILSELAYFISIILASQDLLRKDRRCALFSITFYFWAFSKGFSHLD